MYFRARKKYLTLFFSAISSSIGHGNFPSLVATVYNLVFEGACLCSCLVATRGVAIGGTCQEKV